ncbi:hypothetical protein OWV82_024193 [Melia azedarach]|uniref:Uncharacterized protein n=1 Tax=Melia azedarach TaxID=155640 RepID=A0ACC1WPP3_MELAZ|nr:hypothetical protein OWV82_024193 [Melia azedarach]
MCRYQDVHKNERWEVAKSIGGSSVEKHAMNSGQRRWQCSKLQRPIVACSGGLTAVVLVEVWSPASSDSSSGLRWSVRGSLRAVLL